MPVTRIAAAQRAAAILSTVTSGDIDTALTVPDAVNTYGIAALGYTAEQDIDEATFDVTLGGVSGVSLFDPIYFTDNDSVLRGFIFENPESDDLAATFSGVPFNALINTRNLLLVGGVWSQVEALDLDNIGDNVVTAVASGSAASSSVVVSSVNPAHRVISAHMVGKLRGISGYNHERVASAIVAGGGHLILGEARGDTSVTCTATHNASTANWAGFALNLPPPPVYTGGAARTNLSPRQRVGADIYRLATPHPDREHVIPKLGTADPREFLENFAVTADGVLMPIWEKDPDDTLDYTLHWHNHMAPDDEIVSVEHTVSGTLQKVSEAFEDNMTQVWLSGGSMFSQARVQVRVSTKKGRRHDRTFYIAGVSN